MRSTSNETPLFYTAAEVADRYKMCIRTVRTLIASGQLKPVLRIGRAVRIPVKTVETYEAANLVGR